MLRKRRPQKGGERERRGGAGRGEAARGWISVDAPTFEATSAEVSVVGSGR